MIVGIINLAAAQPKSIKGTSKTMVHTLNYALSHLDTKIVYSASDMTLYVRSMPFASPQALAESRQLVTIISVQPYRILQKLLHVPTYALCKIMRHVLACAT